MAVILGASAGAAPTVILTIRKASRRLSSSDPRRDGRCEPTQTHCTRINCRNSADARGKRRFVMPTLLRWLRTPPSSFLTPSPNGTPQATNENQIPAPD